VYLICILLSACGAEDNDTTLRDPDSGSSGGGSVAETEYRLVFSDEFNQDGEINGEFWTPEIGYGSNGWGNDEWQQYTDSQTNARVEDGHLIIEAHCPTAPNCIKRNGAVTSARLMTLDKIEFKYGKIEARIKPPVGKGAWPAFWLLGANYPEVGWPNSGEIDVMEIHNLYSDERTTHFTAHWCDDSTGSPCQYNPGWVYNTGNRSFVESLGDEFHIFEAIWEENKLIGKIDGITFYNLTINPVTMAEFREEFFIILNIAMGGTLGGSPNSTTVWPQRMEVDYVRVYQKDDGKSTSTIGGGSSGNESSNGSDSVSGLIDFEQLATSYMFRDFGGFAGGTSAVLSNPDMSGNLSPTVARMLKFPGEVYGGSTFDLSEELVVATNSEFSMKVWSSRLVDVLLKLEGGPVGERTAVHTGTGWEQLLFDFSGISGSGTEAITIIFDNGIMGDAISDPLNWTFYFDDIDFRQ
jgi:beta-glucanase (GH16 family)